MPLRFSDELHSVFVIAYALAIKELADLKQLNKDQKDQLRFSILREAIDLFHISSSEELQDWLTKEFPFEFKKIGL